MVVSCVRISCVRVTGDDVVSIFVSCLRHRRPRDVDRGERGHVPVWHLPHRCAHRAHQHAHRYDEPLVRGHTGIGLHGLT